MAAEPEPDLSPEPVLPSEPDRDAVVEPLGGTMADPEVTDVRPVARWPARSDELPDWLVDAEPETESWRATPSSRVHEDAAADPSDLRAEPGVDSAPDLEQEPEPEPPLEAEPEREIGPDRGTAGMPLEDPEPPSVPFWKSILPWRSTEADPGADADADAHLEATAELEPEAERGVEPEADPAGTTSEDVVAAPIVEPRWPASVPEPAGDLAIDAEPDGAAPEGEPAWRDDDGDAAGVEPPTMIPLTGGLTYDTMERWPEPDLANAPPLDPHPDPEPVAADVSDIEPWPAPQAWPTEAERQWEPHPEPEPEPRYEPEPEAEPEPLPEPQPEPTAWSEPEWADRGESTRVLPTDWTPQQPDRGTAQPELSAGEIRTRLADPDADMDQAEPAGTVAEQAVPWLIGVILLLAGMVIVLLALIFAGDGSLGGAGAGEPTPSPTLAALVPTVSASPSPSQSAAATTSATPAPSGTAEPTPTTAAAPEYGPLEMVYQGRSAALAPIYLLRRDFTVDDEPDVLAQDASIDVRRFAWAPDGRVGAGLLADVLVSIEPGKEKRRLGDGLSTITFGADGSTIYGVRITEDGDEDVATVVAIDFESGDTEDLASVTYERPEAREAAALAEAQFTDDGGPVRIVWTADDRLHLWVRGAGAWDVDPAEGAATELEGGSLPVLWSPNGESRVEVTRDDGTTTLTLRNRNERAMASTQVDGLVSHLRWSPASDRVVFTLGRSASGGGILQDLYLWDLGNGDAPMQLTNTGAAFGTEWLGTRPQWRGG